MPSPATVGQSGVVRTSGSPRSSVWPFALGGLVLAIELAWIVLLSWAALALLP